MEDVAESAFRRHYAQIYRFVRRRSATDEQAEDVTQAVFVDATAARSKLRDERPLILGWLHLVARRRLADELRRDSRTPANVVPLEVAGEVAAPHAEDLASGIRAALGRLPESQRQVVVLKLIEGRSFDEIARRVDATPAACKMRLVRALEALRAELEKEGITP